MFEFLRRQTEGLGAESPMTISGMILISIVKFIDDKSVAGAVWIKLYICLFSTPAIALTLNYFMPLVTSPQTNSGARNHAVGGPTVIQWANPIAIHILTKSHYRFNHIRTHTHTHTYDLFDMHTHVFVFKLHGVSLRATDQRRRQIYLPLRSTFPLADLATHTHIPASRCIRLYRWLSEPIWPEFHLGGVRIRRAQPCHCGDCRCVNSIIRESNAAKETPI